MFWLATMLPQPITAQDQRPNYVFIIADDIGWNDFGCYGNSTVKTPQIDKLAGQGLLFTRAFLTASSCSPSRCSIITGRYPHNTGAAELHSPLPETQIPFPLLLKESGYYTVQSGKTHFGQPALRAFDQPYGMEDAGNGGEERWVQCLQERPRDQPFFAWFAAIDAHRDWGADDFHIQHDPSRIEVPPFLVDDENTRNDLASYYNEITRFDFYVGKVMEELENQGIVDETMVVIMSDNGMPFPRAKTRVYDSGMQSPMVIHWPMGIPTPGSVCESLVSVIDLAPTFIELAGVDLPDYFQGKSMAPLLKNPDQSFRQYVFAEHNWHDYEAYERMVRSEEFMYVFNARPNLPNGGPADSKRSPSQASLNQARKEENLTPAQADIFVTPRPREELFQVQDDRWQLLNLASVPEFQNVLKEYRQVFDQWMSITRDDIPANITGDGFDRTTGELLPGIKAFNQVPRGEMPGNKSGAEAAEGTPGFP